MISVAEAQYTELLPLRVRLRRVGTLDEETDERDQQQRRQIHLSLQEICPKNRSHRRPHRQKVSTLPKQAEAACSLDYLLTLSAVPLPI